MTRNILLLTVTWVTLLGAGRPYAQERIVDLPEDGGKWYVSVVGDPQDERYQTLLKLFDTAPLKTLKSQTHFIPVETDTPVFTDRYKPNIRGLPTVRVQDADGRVVYEAAGDVLPGTGDGLYDEIAAAGRRHRHREEPQPKPDPKPDSDPKPQPLDNGGAPVFDEPEMPDWPIGLCVGFVIAGLAWGQIEQYRKYRNQ